MRLFINCNVNHGLIAGYSQRVTIFVGLCYMLICHWSVVHFQLTFYCQSGLDSEKSGD